MEMPRDASAGAAGRERVLSKWREISSLDPWGVLGLAPGADEGAVKRAYFDLAREFHADAWSEVPLGDAAPVLDQVFARIAEAHDILTDARKRAELDAEVAIKASGMSTNLGALFDAEQDFSKGRLLLERGEITAAARFVEKAVQVNPSNLEWRAHHVFASWWPKRDVKDAAHRISELEGLGKQDARLTDAYYFAGRLALEAGDLQKAGRHLRRVTSEHPGHTMATRDMRLLNRKLDEQKKKPVGLFQKLFGKKG